MEITQISPVYVYTQSITPNDVTEGKIWVDTTTNPPLTKISDGTTYNALSTDLSSLLTRQFEQGLGILKLEADGTLTTQDYTTMFLDLFSDVTGYDNTIDTGNTTAFFDTDKYINLGGTPTDESINQATTDQSQTAKSGMAITADVDSLLNSITKVAGCDATICYIHARVGGALLGQANFSGDIATFLPPIKLTATEIYEAIVDKAGNSYSSRYLGGQSHPEDTGNLTWEGAILTLNSSIETGYNRTIYNANVSPSENINLIVQTNAITITTAQTSHQVFTENTLAGTGAISYDISFDNGSTWDTDQALNTKNARACTTGTQMIIKLNLNGTGASNTSEASNYAVMLWY